MKNNILILSTVLLAQGLSALSPKAVNAQTQTQSTLAQESSTEIQKASSSYFGSALEKMSTGNQKGAIEDINRAIELKPNEALYYHTRGVLKSYSGDKQSGIDDYSKAIKIYPDFEPAYMFRGENKFALGDKQGAMDDYNRAIKLRPSPRSYTDRGLVKFELKDVKGAIDDYTQAIKLYPKYAEAYNYRGLARLTYYEYPEGALPDYNEAIKLNPTYAKAYFNRGNLKSYLKDRQGAIADLKKAADLFQEQGNKIDYQRPMKNLEAETKNTK
jgi:tetratricopeptide (TPR) repeat protein